MTQADKFNQAVNQHKEEKAARENRSGGGFTKIIYAPLVENKNKAFRFIGLPHTVRENSTDCKRIFATMITGDDGKKKFFVVPDPETNKGFLAHRIISKVLSYNWDPDGINPQTGKKGIRVYNYAKSHPAIFNMVFKNGNPSQQFERGWQFSPVILANVIDRSDMAWHRENKKLKALSKKVSETASGSLWYERGFPEVLYSTIMEDIVAAFGNWEDYDIVIKKTTSQPFYKAFHGTNDAARFSDDTELLSFISKTGLTAEEKSWEGWDFDDLYKITPYTKWQKELGDSIRRIDKELKTSFYDELIELVAKEEDEKTAAGGSTTTSSSASAPNDDEEPSEESDAGSLAAEAASDQPESPSAPVAKERRSVSPASETKVNLEEILRKAKNLKGINLLTAEEKAWITGVDNEGFLTWSSDAGDLVRDGDTKELVPEKVHCNPYTGRMYEAA